MGYRAALFAPGGDWVVDYRADTIEEIQEILADQGSRWYFYPFHVVIKDNGVLVTGNQRVIDAAWPFEKMKGKTLKTFSNMIRNLSEEEMETILNS